MRLITSLNNAVILVGWIAAVMLWPLMVSFVVRPFSRRCSEEVLIDKIRRRMSTSYHELAHAALGLPFLMIPTKIELRNENADYTDGPGGGQVRRPAFAILPFFGRYFSYFPPVLIGLFPVLLALEIIGDSTLSWLNSTSYIYR